MVLDELGIDMAETERITVAEASGGFGGSEKPGTEVSLPVVELLTGRGFVTGKSGSGKSNSASVIAEKLLDNGFGILIVDIDGEYYGLKEEYEILHAGADEECDIQITADHAEKLASLALEKNVPIILDVSSYLDESEAQEVLTAVARSLFAKAKKQKQPFLLLVEEVHEYIPENGSVGECGKMLIKIGKRGRKHGLGICGISQRPADVKKDFITQCDWLLWHRLTWNNDTKVVGRILDNDYAQAVEDLNDGEGFLMTDWAETVQRVQFYRKQTFDAGATPGLDDFERPDLKSVSDDLVSELEEISDEQKQKENRIAELREELDKKNSRIADLERELQDARDLSRMAEQFVEALVTEVNGPQPGKTERERMRESAVVKQPTETASQPDSAEGSADEGPESAAESDDAGDGFMTALAEAESSDDTGGFEFFGEMGRDESEVASTDGGSTVAKNGDHTPAGNGTETAAKAGEDTHSTEADETEPATTEQDTDRSFSSDFSAEAIMEALNSATRRSRDDIERDRSLTPREQIEQSMHDDAEFVGNTIEESQTDELDEAKSSDVKEDDLADKEPDSQDDSDSSADEIDFSEEPLTVRELKADIAAYPTKSRKMLDVYKEQGPETPLNAHFSAGGDGSRTDAYAHNRRLRTRGLIEHVGRGNYDYRMRELLTEELPESFNRDEIDAFASRIEQNVIDE